MVKVRFPKKYQLRCKGCNKLLSFDFEDVNKDSDQVVYDEDLPLINNLDPVTYNNRWYIECPVCHYKTYDVRSKNDPYPFFDNIIEFEDLNLNGYLK